MARHTDQGRERVTLERLLDSISAAAPHRDRISLAAIVDAVGRRSFGPLLLVAGLITLSPLGDIPGVPTIMAVFVLLIAGQLLLRRHHFWLPRWLLRRSVARGTMDTVLKWLRPPARFVDRLVRPRLTVLTTNAGLYVIALACVVIATAMPPMELVPFTATGAGIALTAFGLSLIANDGLLALSAFVLTGSTLGVILYHLL